MVQCMSMHEMPTVMNGMPYKLKLLPGKEFTNIATGSKKDDCTELANITMPTNQHDTGNLKKVLTAKINARVMITTNIDVTDGLTNGAMGTVTNVLIDETTGKMSTILVALIVNMLDKKQCTQVFITVQTKMLYQYIKHRQHFLYRKKHHFKQQEVSFH